MLIKHFFLWPTVSFKLFILTQCIRLQRKSHKAVIPLHVKCTAMYRLLSNAALICTLEKKDPCLVFGMTQSPPCVLSQITCLCLIWKCSYVCSPSGRPRVTGASGQHGGSQCHLHQQVSVWPGGGSGRWACSELHSQSGGLLRYFEQRKCHWPLSCLLHQTLLHMQSIGHGCMHFVYI